MPTIALTVPVLLIGSVVIVSVLGWVSRALKHALALHPYRVRTGFQLHRLLTAGWVHADASHLFFNMLSLWFFAGDVLRALGTTRFLVLYATAVVVAFIPTTLRHMRDPRYASLGASGAVAAVMFSAVVLYPGLKLQLLFLPIPVPAVVYALGYLAYSVWHSYRGSDGINHDAHFTGALYGVGLTYAMEPARVERTIRALL